MDIYNENNSEMRVSIDMEKSPLSLREGTVSHQQQLLSQECEKEILKYCPMRGLLSLN